MNINISYRQLRAFLLVARLGNFTRAAEHMHVTQAGLSIMVRELESQLDCRLFDRTTRTVTLTPAGEQFLPAAQRTVNELEQSVEQLGALTAKTRDTLRIGVTPLVSSSILPAACQQFRQTQPDIHLKFVDTDSLKVQALVESGDLDFGLGAFFKNTAGMDVTPLFQYELMWITPRKQNRQAPGEMHPPLATAPTSHSGVATVRWSDLADAPLMGLPPENKIQQAIETSLEAIGRAHENRQTFHNFETLIAMVAADMGTAIVPSYAAPACRRYAVDIALLTDPATPINFYRISKRGRPLPDSGADFLAAFTAAVSSSTPRSGSTN